MANRTARLIAILLLVPILNCFEIKEIIKFNKDGSGTFSFQVGIQEQFRAFMAMTRKMQAEKKKKAEEAEKKAAEEAEGSESSEDPDMDPAFAEIEREEKKKAAMPKKELGDFEESSKKIAKIPGISNVRGVRDEENFRFGINFDFADITALNRALHGMQKNPGKEVTYFKLSGGSLERRPIVGFQEALEKQMKKGKEGGKPDFNPALLGIKFLYITEYTFAREIRKVSNPRAQVLADKRTVRMEHSMFDPEQRETNVGNTVEFKRWYHTCLPFL